MTPQEQLAETTRKATEQYIANAMLDPEFHGKSRDFWEGFQRGAREISEAAAKTLIAHFGET